MIDDQSYRDLLQRLARLEQEAVRYRQGVLTDDGPLTVSLGGATTSVQARSLAGATVDDDARVGALTFGADVLLLGGVGATLGVPFVTALPSPAFDGQVVDYQNAAMATQGVIWRFRYNAASASSYKWERVGGMPLAVEEVGGRTYGTHESTTSLTFTTLATAGPAITVPLTGEYQIRGSAAALHATAGNLAGVLFWKTGDGAPSWTIGHGFITVAGNATGGMIHLNRRGTLTAGNSIELRYASSTASSAAHFWNRCIYLEPVRVG